MCVVVTKEEKPYIPSHILMFSSVTVMWSLSLWTLCPLVAPHLQDVLICKDMICIVLNQLNFLYLHNTGVTKRERMP